MKAELHINRTVEPDRRPGFNDWFRHIQDELTRLKQFQHEN